MSWYKASQLTEDIDMELLEEIDSYGRRRHKWRDEGRVDDIQREEILENKYLLDRDGLSEFQKSKDYLHTLTDLEREYHNIQKELKELKHEWHMSRDYGYMYDEKDKEKSLQRLQKIKQLEIRLKEVIKERHGEGVDELYTGAQASSWYKRSKDEQLDLFEDNTVKEEVKIPLEKEDKKEEDNIRFLNIFNKREVIFKINDKFYGYYLSFPEWANKIKWKAETISHKKALVDVRKMVEKDNKGYAMELEENPNFPSGFKMIREI